MSWTDKKAIEHIKKIRDIFKIKTFVETGTFKGVNAQLQSKHFKRVLTCENNQDFFLQAYKRLKDIKNVFMFFENSPDFLKRFNHSEPLLFYLDAHFYDKNLKNKFVVLEELENLRGRKNVVIIIHDFDNCLGHIVYDGQPLNLDLLKDKLRKINPTFKFYTNELSSCDIVKPNKEDIIKAGLTYDKEVRDNLKYAWSEPRLTYRGILYCLPEEVNINGLRKFKG